MKPSTKVAIGAGVGLVGVLVGLHFALPRISVWLGRAQTGLESSEGKLFTAYAANKSAADQCVLEADTFTTEFVKRWGASRTIALPESRISIYLFQDHDALSRHSLFKMGMAFENNGGYFSAAERAIALVNGESSGLNHELTHMLLGLSWPGADLSSWFSEGHAQWHEAGVEGGIPRAAAIARTLFVQNRAIPLQLLLEAPNTAFAGADNTRYYAEAASLFAWLSIEKPGALQRVFMLERQPGRPTPREFAAELGMPLEEIATEWRSWVLR